jgi:hypothetical protein
MHLSGFRILPKVLRCGVGVHQIDEVERAGVLCAFWPLGACATLREQKCSSQDQAQYQYRENAPVSLFH